MTNNFKIALKASGIVIGILVLASAIYYITILILWEESDELDAEVEIFKNSDFQNYDFIYGNGTFKSPYIIENLIIDTDKFQGIYIEDITAHFVIRNCSIKAMCSGITIQASSKILIQNNTIEGGEEALYVVKPSLGPYSSSIFVDICDNILKGSFYPLYVDYTPNSRIHNNVIIRKDSALQEGVFIKIHENTTITDNNLYHTSFANCFQEITEESSFAFENNFANSEPILLLFREENKEIADVSVGQIILLMCKNITLDKLEIKLASFAVGIYFCSNLTIVNNVIESYRRNLDIEASETILIFNNTFRNAFESIFIRSSNNIDIMNNTIYENDYGIFITGCSNNYIAFNNFTSNRNYAVSCHGSNGNWINYNMFIENNPEGTSQAREVNGSNNWGSNWWSDYDGGGRYDIDGETAAADHNPKKP